MKQSLVSRLCREPAAVAALALFALSAATLAGAWFFQLVVKLPPCPLCLEERIAYHVIIPLSLLMTIAAVVHAPQKLLTVGFIVIMIAALCNAVLGGYHSGVEWHWWQGPVTCTGNPNALVNNAGDLLAVLQSENVVRCDQPALKIAGLSLAAWNIPIGLALAALAARSAWLLSRPGSLATP